MKAMLDESGGNELMEGLTLKTQKSAKQLLAASEHLKSSNRKKHNRRTAKEIERSFICPYQSC